MYSLRIVEKTIISIVLFIILTSFSHVNENFLRIVEISIAVKCQLSVLSYFGYIHKNFSGIVYKSIITFHFEHIFLFLLCK